MSYIFSHALMADYVNCTSLQAREAVFSQANCSDTEPSAPSSGNPTPKLSLWHDKTMDASRLSRFGMTCKILTEDRGAALLTWWLAVSRARTYPSQEKAQESPENDPGCGLTWRGSLAKYDPDSRSWKTAQLSLLRDSELSSVIWPRSGMTAGGLCWELPTLERRTSGTEYGFLLPTPLSTLGTHGGPNQRDSSGRPGLQMAARNWPTPQASDNRDRGNMSTPAIARRIEKNKQVMLSMSVSTESGRLNPQWVAWLMGWPIDHTSLKPSGTDKCPNVPQPPGDYSEAQHDVL